MRSTKSWPYGFWGAGGHSVLLARNGLEALDILNQHVIDVVLMDVQMAEIDGLQATANICKREQESGGHIPIFSMTAYAMKAIWNNAWRPELTATSRSRSTPKN